MAKSYTWWGRTVPSPYLGHVGDQPPGVQPLVKMRETSQLGWGSDPPRVRVANQVHWVRRGKNQFLGGRHTKTHTQLMPMRSDH